MAWFGALLPWLLFQISSAQVPHETTFTYFTEPKLEWQQALDFCRGQGQELIRVTSQAEHDFLTSLVHPHGVWGKENRENIWSSLHDPDPARPGVGYYWQLVHPARCQLLKPESWTHWAKGNPYVDHDHSCVQLTWDRNQNFEWETEKCFNKNRAICRRDKGICDSYEANTTHTVKMGSSQQRVEDDDVEEEGKCQKACSKVKAVNSSSCYAAEWTDGDDPKCVLHVAQDQFSQEHLEPSQNGSAATLYLRKCLKAVLNKTRFDINRHKPRFNSTCLHNTSATTTGDEEASSITPPPPSSPTVATLQQTTKSNHSTTPSTTTMSSATFDTATSGDPAVATSEIPNTSSSGIFNTSTSRIPSTTTLKIPGIFEDQSSTAATPENVETSTLGIVTTSEIINTTTSGVLTASENVDANSLGIVTTSESVHTSTSTSLPSPPPVTVTTPPKVSREEGSSSSSAPTDSPQEGTLPPGTNSNPHGSSTTPAHKRQHPAILCPCATCVRKNATVAAEQQKVLSQMLKTLAVDQKNTTLFKRKHTSAPDQRRSAQMIGCLGLVVLVTVLAVFVITDAIGLLCSRVQRVGPNREKARKAGKSD